MLNWLIWDCWDAPNYVQDQLLSPRHVYNCRLPCRCLSLKCLGYFPILILVDSQWEDVRGINRVTRQDILDYMLLPKREDILQISHESVWPIVDFYARYQFSKHSILYRTMWNSWNPSFPNIFQEYLNQQVIWGLYGLFVSVCPSNQPSMIHIKKSASTFIWIACNAYIS